MIDEDQPSTWSKIRLWFSSLENRFAFVGNIVFLVAITTRSVLPIDLFRWARYFYSITVVIYWLISMRFLFVYKNIGPKVVMIGKMVNRQHHFNENAVVYKRSVLTNSKAY